MPVDDKTLSDLKLAQAHFFQQLFASDQSWNEFRKMYAVYEALLSLQKQLQPRARRYEKDPIRFCEWLMGKDWSDAPSTISTRQAEGLIKLTRDGTRSLTDPNVIGQLDGSVLFKLLQTLAARPPGRKPSDIYTKALQLRQGAPAMRFHDICRHLNPAYSGMSPDNKRRERERMRIGVARLQKKAASQTSQGQRNTHR